MVICSLCINTYYFFPPSTLNKNQQQKQKAKHPASLERPPASSGNNTNTTMKALMAMTILFSAATPSSMAFTHTLPKFSSHVTVNRRTKTTSSTTTTQIHLFDGFGNPLEKVFEEDGPLGKGITVGKVQVAINVSGAERVAKDGIFAKLAQHARADSDGYDEDYEDGYGDSKLSKMCHDVCLTLLRQSDSWTAACSESQWFKGSDAGKAESLFNQWADREASKFEKVSLTYDASRFKKRVFTTVIITLPIY